MFAYFIALAAHMPEPTASTGIGLTALAIALMGPMAGPYSLIVFASLAGALWPLSGAEPMTRKIGAWLLVRCTLTAIILTGIIASQLSTMWGIPAMEALAPVAFLIGALGNGWRPLFNAVGRLFSRVIGDK